MQKKYFLFFSLSFLCLLGFTNVKADDYTLSCLMNNKAICESYADTTSYINICSDWDGTDELCFHCLHPDFPGGDWWGAGCDGDIPFQNNLKVGECSVKQQGHSVINETNNTYTESIAITGSPLSLVYGSDRGLGRVDDYIFKVPLKTSVPLSFNNISVEIDIAGRNHVYNFPALFAPDTFEWTWDGKDNLGDIVPWSAIAEVKVSYTNTSPPTMIQYGHRIALGNPKFQILGLGGWSLSNNHFYDMERGRIYFGNGDAIDRDIIEISPGLYGASIDADKEIYVFNDNGLHVQTWAGLTGEVIGTFTYNGNAQLTSYTDAFGQATTINRNFSGNMTGITTPYGVTTTVTLDGDGFLESVTNPNSETFSMTYTASKMLETFTKPTGEVTTFHVNSLGNLTKDSHSGGSFLEYISSYGISTNTYEKTSAVGREQTIRVSQSGSGMRTQVTDALGVVSSTQHSFQGSHPINITTGDITRQFDKTWNPRFEWYVTAPHTESEIHGALQRDSEIEYTLSLSNPLNPFSIITQTASKKINNDSNKVYTSSYAGASKTWLTTTPEGRTNSVTLNDFQLPVSTQEGTFTPVSFQYNLHGRPSQTSQGLRETDYTYNTQGYLHTVTNALGQTTTYGYDLAGRVTSETLADLRVIGYSYDSSGRLTGVTPPGKPKHDFFYNMMEVLEVYLPPILGTPKSTEYVYNSDKDLIEIKRPDGSSVYRNHNLTTGMLDSISTSSTTLFSYIYETTKGLISSMASYDGLTNSFDYNGNFLSEDVLSDTATSTQLGKVSYVYDNNFWVTNMSVQGSTLSIPATLTYTRDNDGLVTSVASATYDYKMTSPTLEEITLGSSVESLSYNTFGEFTGKGVTYSSSPVYNVNYTRDDLGRVATKTEVFNSITNVFVYSYDVTGRLTTVTKNGLTYSSYTRDSNNNVTSGTIGGNSVSATYDNQDRILTFNDLEFTHNDNGELIEQEDTSISAVTAYDYNAMGELIQVTLPSTDVVSYKIDGSGRRYSRSLNNVFTHRYLYNGDLQMIAEIDGSGSISSQYIYVSQLHSPDFMIRAGLTYKFIKDHLGSIRAVLKTTDGTIVQAIEYNEFGKVLSDSNPGFQPFGFAGGLYDHQTGLVKFGAREYNGNIGRWMSKDPILFNGGDTNLYGYVLENPINFVDSSGLSAADVERIKRVFNESVKRMNKSGLRREGSGNINGMINNLQTWGGKKLGCGAQADQTIDDIVGDIMKNGPLDDKWKFEIVNPNPFHQNIRATSSNANDPVLTIDPWSNRFSK